MFNNLAAYLLGTSSTPPQQQQQARAAAAAAAAAAEASSTYRHHHNSHHQHQQQQLNSIRLNASSTAVLPVHVSGDDDDEGDGDWVLVDRDQGDNRDSEGNSTLESSSEEEGDSDYEQSPTAKTSTDYDITHLLLPSTSTTSPPHTYRHAILQPAPTAYTTLTALSPASTTQSQQLPSTMEESWFLTPPPCFTSTGPVHMETSPLENLLIEHPSMSVYQNVSVAANRVSRSGETAGVQGASSTIASTAASSSNNKPDTSTTVILVEELPSDLEDEAAEALLFEVDEEVERGYLRAAQQQQRRRRGNGQRGYSRLSAAEVMRYQHRPPAGSHMVEQRHSLVEGGQQQHMGLRNKQAQKVQIHKACQSLKRSYLERNNKAREVNFRNQRLRRGERSQGSQRSNANNNRKCC